MSKFFGLLGLLVLLAVPALAQDTPAPAAPPAKPAKVKRTYSTPKVELSGGYTFRRFQDIDGHSLGMNGWYFSANYNFRRWLGGELEVSSAGRNQYFNGDTKVSSILAGPKIYPFGHRKFTPFAEIVIGTGLYRNAVPAFGAFPANEPTYAAFMWQGGAGLDYNRWKHFGIRLVQVDYGKASFFPNYQDNHFSGRVSAGVVYRFGEK